MDGDVDLALVQGLAHRGDEDAGAAEAGERGHVDIAFGDDLDDLDPPPGQGRDLVGDRRRLRAGELGAARAQADGPAAGMLGFDDVEGVVGDGTETVGLDVLGALGLRDLRLRGRLRMGDLDRRQVEELDEGLGVVDVGFGDGELLDLDRRGVDELLRDPVE